MTEPTQPEPRQTGDQTQQVQRPGGSDNQPIPPTGGSANEPFDGQPMPAAPWGSAPTATWPPAAAVEQPPASRRVAPWKKVAGGVALAAVVAVGGVAAVTAANASSANGSTQPAAGGAGNGQAGYGPGEMGPGGQLDGAPPADGAAPGMGGGFGGRGGSRELAGALHGEFVVPNQAGGTLTRRLQTGAVTAVSADSITVTSTDGFSASYVIGADLDVSGVAVGDTVQVIATVDGDTATATSVRSQTADLPDHATGDGALPGGSAPTTEAPQTS